MNLGLIFKYKKSNPNPMKYFYLAVLACLLTKLQAQTTTYFEQNFNSSSEAADYKGGGLNKFTELLANSPSTLDLSSQNLTFTKAAGSQVRFAKTDDLFTATPTVLYVQFTISANITEVSSATTPYNYLYFGNLNDNGSLPANASVFARLGFHFNTVGDSFQLHLQEGGSVNKGPYSGTKTITWVMNVSGAPTTYTDGSGHSGSLEGNKMDIWVDVRWSLTKPVNCPRASFPMTLSSSGITAMERSRLMT